MDNFDLKKYLAEGRLLSEIQYKEGDFNAISIGDKFIDTKKNIFTVVDVFSPGFTTEIEQIKLEDSNGNQSIWPDDFIDIDVEDGSFFDFFSTYNKDIAPDQTIFRLPYWNIKGDEQVTLLVAADNIDDATLMADEYMEDNYDRNNFDLFIRGKEKLSEPFGDLNPEDQKLFKGNIGDYGIQPF